ncbi:MAG: DUF4440 domain-containing protein [Candidatus Nanopelagicales bacterium]
MPTDDIDDVVACERLLLEPNIRARPDAVLARLHPEFVEFGASGRTWDGPAVADALAVEAMDAADSGCAPRLEARDLTPVRLADGVVLLTYTVDAVDRRSLRSSVWVRDPARGWLLRFHQGTPVPSGE